MRSEMTDRVQVWTEHLKEDISTQVLTVPTHRMLTYENLGFDRVHDMLREQQDMPDWSARTQHGEGESGVFYADYPAAWGRKWEYGWFYCEIDLNDHPGLSLKGARLELLPDVGGEMLVEVNGSLAGSRDLRHETVTLTRCAKGDERFTILIESYAGHGPRLENGGPLLYGTAAVPEPPLHQVRTERCALCVRNETAYGLYMDLAVLMSLYRTLEPRSYRAQQVLEAMFSATRIMDLECPPNDRNRSYLAAREALRPALKAVNGTQNASFSVFGQSHLDLAWKWTEAETRRKCARTYSNQLALLDEYPDYIFFGCSPYILETLEKDYPELSERVQQKIREGRIIVDGGMYIEPDVQMPEGESLIRQIGFAQEWSMRHTGRRMELLWLPDTFGFSGQLPQIMAQCGLKYFSSQKLSRAKKGTEPFPYNDFLWEGIDGTRVQAHFFKKNNAAPTPEDFHERWYTDRVQDEYIGEMLFPFGFGDGGGGAVRDMVEAVERMHDLEGIPACRYEDPVSFCRRLAERTEKKLNGKTAAEDVNVYCGELYLSWHRGVWTGQTEIKRKNRRAEQALRDAELWNAIAVYLGLADAKDVSGRMERLWKQLLFLQFHDVLPGTSIERVNDEAKADFDRVISEAEQASLSAKRLLLPDCEAVWNPVGKDRELNASGALVPACGYVTAAPDGDPDSVCCRKEKDRIIFENGCLRAEIDLSGRIVSLKKNGTEFLSAPANVLRMYRNLNTEYDAWELTSYYHADVCENARGETELISCGTRRSGASREAFASFRFRIGDSPAVTTLSLSENGKEIDIELEVDWRETHKILQVEFPTIVHADRYIAETQYGYVTRPNHRSRPSDRDRFEGCMHRYCALAGDNLGAILLNDGIYGCSAEGGTMTLSLLRAAKRPDGNADLGRHVFRYAVRPYFGSFAESGAAAAGRFFETPVAVPKVGPVGQAKSASWLRIGTEENGKPDSGILIDWVKTAADGSGDLIVRLYESMNSYESAVLSAAMPAHAVYRCDALEEKLYDITDSNMCRRTEEGTAVKIDLKPFEFITIRFAR